MEYLNEMVEIPRWGIYLTSFMGWMTGFFLTALIHRDSRRK